MINKYYRLINSFLEYCFLVELKEALNQFEEAKLIWLLSETFEPQNFSSTPSLEPGPNQKLIEVYPRLNVATPWNSAAVTICHSCGLGKVLRLERARRVLAPKQASLHTYFDRMTEMTGHFDFDSLYSDVSPAPLSWIPIKEEGVEAFSKVPGLLLSHDEAVFYYDYFVIQNGRNPSLAEMMDLYNANSEHSRHSYFKGQQVIDGLLMPKSLMELVQSTLAAKPENSVIGFHDNASAISGFVINDLVPKKGIYNPEMVLKKYLSHLTFTAETHNFPTGVSPFEGANTGTGGRIRDNKAAGKGAKTIAATAGYCVSSLNFGDSYRIPGSINSPLVPTLASPLKILIRASDGASDYGNKYGEPVIAGFVRSFCTYLSDLKKDRRELYAYLKPAMFTGGIGKIWDIHVKKGEPEKGLLVVAIGGPAFGVGYAGGGASSQLQGDNSAELDYNAVQRGDPEMGRKVVNVIRTCVDMGPDNPIISIHDQGAGGPANVLKELVEKVGAQINIRAIKLGDPSLSDTQIWVAEYQERYGLLIKVESLSLFQSICEREDCPLEILGETRDDQRFLLYDGNRPEAPFIVDLQLDKVLGGLPGKTFYSDTDDFELPEFKIPKSLNIMMALEIVLRQINIGSKGYLINKVDRSVTGLIVRQQGCGPLHLPVADVGVVALSHFPDASGYYSGGATAIGEQPIKMLIAPEAGARMTVAEAISNLAAAGISSLDRVKCSANWMCAPKLPHEGSKMYRSASAMVDFMVKLGVAVDGGKDSLSMATRVGDEIVKSPSQLVVSAYCDMPDITKVLTPDIKRPGESKLYHVRLNNKHRLGGSALAQGLGQIGNESPDIDEPEMFVKAFNVIQNLIDSDLLLSIHDISDGGLIVAVLEMLFSGNCGLDMHVKGNLKPEILASLFAEEVGWVLEVDSFNSNSVKNQFRAIGLVLEYLGTTKVKQRLNIRDASLEECLDASIPKLRQLWSETGFHLEKLQCDPSCAEQEYESLLSRKKPVFNLTFQPLTTEERFPSSKSWPVAIIRDQGSNGDREMAAAFKSAGFSPRDVHMNDLLSGKANLADFRILAFVGGFSNADVMDSAKGWAGTIMFNSKLKKMFDCFYKRPDTLSFGVCNGAQLSLLLGWATDPMLNDLHKPRFITNKSRRFESRFPTVRVLESPAVMLKGMAGSVFGIWSAHGEGRAYFPNREQLEFILGNNLAPLRLVNDDGLTTESYPFNPSGSEQGITALCSPDGRHLAMMPHPERTFLTWQFPYLPEDWKENLQVSPCLHMFQNALEWLNNH